MSEVRVNSILVLDEPEMDQHFLDGCLLAAMPPIGGHIRIADRHGNMRDLRVVDVVVEAVTTRLRSQLPSSTADLGVSIACVEFFEPEETAPQRRRRHDLEVQRRLNG